MKKVCFLLLLLTASVNAQSLEFGVKGGANFSNIDSNNYDASTLTSYYFGAFAELNVFENLSIQPEVLYSSQGAQIDDADDIELNYINIPVLAKFYLTSKTLSLEAGPQFGFLLDSNVPNQFETESYDFSVVGGIGYNLTKNISIHARYVAGLTDASKNAEVTNTVFQVGVGYKF